MVKSRGNSDSQNLNGKENPERQSPMARCSDDDYSDYLTASPEQRQKMLHSVYESIDPLDLHATFRDHNLRELEITAFKKHLTMPGSILDLGSGNGYTLLRLAEDLDWPMTGVDFSENLVRGSMSLLANWPKPLKSKPDFVIEDCIRYIASVPDASQDYVLSARFIQNLPIKEIQHNIICEISRALKPGGRYLMCEGSATGFEALNDLREAAGLSRISPTSAENMSAIRFDDDDIDTYVKSVGFDIVAKEGFSLYFIISRIVHPWLVAPDSPKFSAPINEIAGILQTLQPMQPGLGSNTLWVMEKRDS